MINDFTGSGNVLSLGAATGLGTTILDPTTATMTVSLGGSGSGRHCDQPVRATGWARIAPIGFNVTQSAGRGHVRHRGVQL